MRTLLSINNYYYRRGGAEAVFFEQNRLFAEHGWNVIPFAMQHQNNLDTPWSAHFVEEIEYGQRYSLRQKLARVPKVIYSHEARRKLGRLLDQVQPDVAHAHNIYHHLSPSILGTLKERGVPVVLTLHDLKLACPAYKMWRPGGVCERCKGGALHNVLRYRCIKNSSALSALVLLESAVHEISGLYRRHIDRFVVPSRFHVDKFVEWGWDRERFAYIPNFVDAKSLRPDFTAGRAFLYFGRLMAEKGLATLIRASVMAEVPVWFAGAGPEEAALRRLAEDLGADVTFLGHRNGEALHDVVRSARAVVLPSELYENAPMSVMEAYALGKPVIGAAIGGIPELIRENETGITFESGNAEALAASLRRLTDAPDRQLADMARAGRDWMVADFTAERYRERVLELYQQLGVPIVVRETLATADATHAEKESLVSVIIPTRNRPQMLAVAVASALNQTHGNIEVIVVDDGSDTPLSLNLSDDRVRIIRNERSMGGAAARNIGLRAARGEFLCLLDDDDYYYPHKITCQLDYLIQHPDVDMVFSQVCRDDRHGGFSMWPFAGYEFSPIANFRAPNKIHTIATLFRRKVIERVQFDERFTKYQDWQFNMTISLKFNVHYLPICVAVWHVDKRPDRLTHQGELAQFINYRLVCEIFSDLIDSDPAMWQRYYRRLGYLALKTKDWQCAKETFHRLGPWSGRLWLAYSLLKSKAWAIQRSYKARRANRRLPGLEQQDVRQFGGGR